MNERRSESGFEQKAILIGGALGYEKDSHKRLKGIVSITHSRVLRKPPIRNLQKPTCFSSTFFFLAAYTRVMQSWVGPRAFLQAFNFVFGQGKKPEYGKHACWGISP